MKNNLPWLAALLGASAVALGAFGAHALHAQLEALGRVQTWETAAHYHLLHALGVLGLAVATRERPPGRLGLVGWIWAAGIVFFAGSLYALGFGAPRWFGAITPLGGTAFIVGWLMLPWALSEKP